MSDTTEKLPPSKNKTAYDAASGTLTVTVPGNDPLPFSITMLPPAIQAQMAARGVASVLNSAKDGPSAAYERLKRGEYGRAPAGPKELDPKRLAIAMAIVEETKKAATPTTLEQAKKIASSFDRSAVAARMTLPSVVKHYHKVSGAKLVSLLPDTEPVEQPSVAVAA